jgi:hypothetical protein
MSLSVGARSLVVPLSSCRISKYANRRAILVVKRSEFGQITGRQVRTIADWVRTRVQFYVIYLNAKVLADHHTPAVDRPTQDDFGSQQNNFWVNALPPLVVEPAQLSVIYRRWYN